MKAKGKIAFAAMIVASGAVLVATQTAWSGGQSRKSKIVISINDVPNGAPVIQVQGAPNGYAIYNGPEVSDPAIEDGSAIVLYGVDQFGSIPDWGGGFTIPNAPNPFRSSVDIVWVAHDPGIVQAGALVVAFNSALPGTYYHTPGPVSHDDNLGQVTDNWVTVYENDTLVIRFKPHTYRLRN
jgi:hypothetical protein